MRRNSAAQLSALLRTRSRAARTESDRVVGADVLGAAHPLVDVCETRGVLLAPSTRSAAPVTPVAATLGLQGNQLGHLGAVGLALIEESEEAVREVVAQHAQVGPP